jgi:hypothetical protein
VGLRRKRTCDERSNGEATRVISRRRNVDRKDRGI